MAPVKLNSLLIHFTHLPDPRLERRRLHELGDILCIMVCAVLCGADSFVDMEKYGKAKLPWLKTFLELANGIPSHDTFDRVLGRLDPEAFRRCFLGWIESLARAKGLKQIAIDGKTLRRSFDNIKGLAAVHVVSAWAVENHLTLGQQAVDEKSNEITAIPQLLDMLDIQDAVVTIDAMGCQKEIAARIREKDGDYVLMLKDNQPNLLADVQQAFITAAENDYREGDHDVYESSEKAHGRVETRTVHTLRAPDTIRHQNKWRDLRTIGMVYSERRVNGAEPSGELRYFISSLQASAKDHGRAIRGHWGIENSLHWILDVSFREDDCRVRKHHGPENFAMIRRFAVSLLKQSPVKGGVHCKRLQAGWDNDILLAILGA